MSKLKRNGPAILLVLIAIAIVGALRFVTPMYRVASGSMEPTLPVGSMVLIHQESNYQPGDIITFHADNGEVVTHRLVSYGSNGDILTKGDANPTPDDWNGPVTKSDVMGKVILKTSVTTAGFWKSGTGIGVLLCVILIGLLLLTREKKSSDDASESEASEKLSESSPV